VVGPDIKMKGAEISDCDTLVVEGRIEATLDSRVLEITQHGVFQGTIAVDNAEIHGRFEGELTVRKQLIIHGTGKVSGKIRYAKIKIEESAGSLRRGLDLDKAQSQAPSRAPRRRCLKMAAPGVGAYVGAGLAPSRARAQRLHASVRFGEEQAPAHEAFARPNADPAPPARARAPGRRERQAVAFASIFMNRYISAPAGRRSRADVLSALKENPAGPEALQAPRDHRVAFLQRRDAGAARRSWRNDGAVPISLVGGRRTGQRHHQPARRQPVISQTWRSVARGSLVFQPGFAGTRRNAAFTKERRISVIGEDPDARSQLLGSRAPSR
jgi:cytoskeletal protein CcmA (bactofilin family)